LAPDSTRNDQQEVDFGWMALVVHPASVASYRLSVIHVYVLGINYPIDRLGLART
jgi:hypothetical protein